jgi:hypothetical protein
MKKNTLVASLAIVLMGLAGTAQAEMLTGKVASMDQKNNPLTLTSESYTASSRTRR